jgi:hypothetical protein
MKKETPLNTSGSQQKTSDEKRGTPKYKGLQIKTSNEKRNTPKHKGLRPKIFDEKRGTLKKFKGLKNIRQKKNLGS